MQADSSPSTSNERLDAPSATLDVFAQLIRHDAGGSGSGRAEGERRTKLFMMATKLAKLNLKDESASTSSSPSSDSSLAIWETVLQFLKAYPDYIFYKPPVREHSNGSDHGPHDEQSEEMAAWLLPRLLRRIAVLGAEARPSEKVNKIKQAAEEWLSAVLGSLSSQFYQQQFNGIAKQREYVHELLSLVQCEPFGGACERDADQLLGIQDAMQPHNKTPFPLKLWLFDKGPKFKANGAGKDPFLDAENRDKRPFAVILQSAAQARALSTSLAGILISVVLAHPVWLQDAIPALASAVIGSDADWNLPIDAKGKGIARVPDSAIANRLGLAQKVLSRCSNVVKSTAESLRECILARILSFYEHSVLGQPNQPSGRVLQALLDCVFAAHEQPSTAESLSARLYRDTIARNESLMIACLLDTGPVTNIETGKEECTPAQAITLLLLIGPVFAATDEGALGHSAMRSTCECMALPAKRSLQEWIEKHADVVIPGMHHLSPLLSKATKAASLTLQSSGRKRKGDMNCEPTGTYSDEVEHVLALAGLQNTEGWRTQGWQYALAQAIGNADLRADALGAIPALIRIEGQHRVEATEVPFAEAVPETNVRRMGRMKLHLLSSAIFRAVSSASPKQDARQKAVAYSTLGTVFDNENNPCLLTDARMSVVMADLRHNNRLVRLAAGQAGNALVLAHLSSNSALDANGHSGRYFDALKSVIASGPMSAKATAITSVAHLCRSAADAILGRALELLLLGLSHGGQLKALIITQVCLEHFRARRYADVVSRSACSSHIAKLVSTDYSRRTLNQYVPYCRRS